LSEPEFDADDAGGFDVDDWRRLKAFADGVATLDDVQAKRAVFALADTLDPRRAPMDLPQPAIWWDDDGAQAAVVVQAEIHQREDEDQLEVLGLILPDGSSAVALLEDVDLVDETDPAWREMVENAVGEEAGD
jgi:hypothetical protein